MADDRAHPRWAAGRLRRDRGIMRRLAAASDRPRTSWRSRLDRLREKSWHVGQCAVAAAVAWYVAADLVGHPSPFVAPVAAVVALGTSYGQRLRRVAEVAVGVAVGVAIADALVLTIGSGGWQIGLVVALAMSTALLLDSGQVLLIQSAVQGIVVAALIAPAETAFLRWTDALIGGAVALVAATVVPGAVLRRPRQQAARCVRRLAELLRGAADGIRDPDVDRTLALLQDARATDRLVRELQLAAEEGLSVTASSPFRRRHRSGVRQVADLIEPLDRAIRTTRVLVRRVAVAAYQGEPVPTGHAEVCAELAQVCELIAEAWETGREPAGARERLLDVGERTAHLERTRALSAEVLLGQERSLVVDLLQLVGLGRLEATDTLPPMDP